MSINGIGSYQVAATIQYSGQSVGAIESDGDADRSRITAPTNAGSKTGLFTSAISQTLFQIGVTPAAANVATGAAPTNTQQQAFNSFAQDLFGALQPGATGKPAVTAGAKTSPAVAKKDGRPGAGSAASPSSLSNGQLAGSNAIESRLQALIQQVGNESGAPQDSTDEALSALEQSYQGLLSAQGASATRPSLASFLQVLAQNLQDAPTTGTLLNVTA
ncbi:MAG: hypothetical protein JO269_05055 [Burkholderiaceae bacterium]|nr:hypothetical protein [Burkholderiaceae bacterium]